MRDKELLEEAYGEIVEAVMTSTFDPEDYKEKIATRKVPSLAVNDEITSLKQENEKLRTVLRRCVAEMEYSAKKGTYVPPERIEFQMAYELLNPEGKV